MIKISLIMPFRERIDMFRNLMKTLIDTTKDPASIEILTAVDDTDLVVIPMIPLLEKEYENFNLRFHITKPSVHFVKDYWNFVAKKAVGRFIMAINDDSEFMTVDWDKQVYGAMSERAEKLGDDIVYGLMNDGIDRRGEDALYPNFCSWCLVSKQSVDFLGYFYDERYWVWGPDHMVADVYRQLTIATGHKRLVSIMSVKIEHNSLHNKRREVDENHARFTVIDTAHQYTHSYDDVKAEMMKLKQFIYENKLAKK